MASRILAVFGATGLQGSSVIDAILKDGTFTPRAITRDVKSEASLKLRVGVTIPTSFSKPGTPSETEQGRNIVDAAKEVGVKFFVFSSLPSSSELSGGKYEVAHFDDKAVVQKYLQASGLPNASILLGAFLENFWRYGQLKKTPSGFDIATPYSPTAKQSFTWVGKDLSASVVALLKSYNDPSKGVSGNAYPVVTGTITFPELALIISQVIPTFGNPEMDKMVACQAEYDGLYTPVPNPELVALEVKFGSVQEFVEKEIKPRFLQ
ncbi:hypothetical protein C8J57DRAFT_1214719 [Mycena rebaudengoi]|nr:hypothetical protein C8J57DRAFT_1214719 [Mycena rebaudengoi]